MLFSIDEHISKSSTLMEIAAYPEKFTDDITVEIVADSEDHCILVLSNSLGRILRMMGVNINQGKNQVHFDNVNALEAGIYQISVKNKNSIVLYNSVITKS